VSVFPWNGWSATLNIMKNAISATMIDLWVEIQVRTLTRETSGTAIPLGMAMVKIFFRKLGTVMKPMSWISAPSSSLSTMKTHGSTAPSIANIVNGVVDIKCSNFTPQNSAWKIDCRELLIE